MEYPGDYINKIICGDCLEVMSGMPDGCVDLCVADPPFNVGKDYGKFDDKKKEKEYWNWITKRIEEIFRVLKENSRFYVFHTDFGVFKLRPICEKAGFKFHQMLIWYGPNTVGAGSRISKDWNCMHENILLFHKGKRTPMLQASHVTNSFSVQCHVRPQSNFSGGRDHPAQKPVSLLACLISRSPGEIVLDPFCGVGSSLIAAKNLGRNFTGIEINPDYRKIAEERLSQRVFNFKD